MGTIFCVDDKGKYLGAFAAAMATVQVDEATVEERELEFELPKGAIRIDAPPGHGSDVLTDFKIKNGVAVGGSWDTGNRPVPPPSAEERVLDALKQAGVITEKQATAAMDVLSAS